MTKNILITGCKSCPMYNYEEGYYPCCNFYDEYFELAGLHPKGAERPDFCKVKEINVMEE